MRMLSPITLSDWSWPTNTLASSLLDDFFSDFERPMMRLSHSPTASQNFSLQYDVKETREHYLLSFDVPGMKKDDLNIEVKNGQLTISGERRRDVNTEGSENSIRFGRSYGKFERMFTLPENVNAENIEAQYEDGVLNLAIPKVEEPKGRNIEIQSEKSGIFSKLLGAKTKNENDKVVDVKAS